MKTHRENKDDNKSISSKSTHSIPSTKGRGLNEDQQKQRINTDGEDEVIENEDIAFSESEDSKDAKDRPFSTPRANEEREIKQRTNSPKSR
jgi:hypothetical protein